ncbi:hypothetical protein RISK_005991 [Rhodopirellula islandica]|uniref:Uncharacterized protein n=1 Tax=Rhodopirellula islandica TaxID=595434 RepID=A0A0J1B4Z6_RHOIS|nr:hypothetical protein RISK_005991 [Rhodopirellula islandica]
MWRALFLPHTTGANAQTAHLVVLDHSCQPASQLVFLGSILPRMTTELNTFVSI